MKKVLPLFLLLTGCTTLGNLNTMNRLLPQVQQLVYLEDKANNDGTPVQQSFCGPDREEIMRIAKLMGWVESPELTKMSSDGTQICEVFIYTKK